MPASPRQMVLSSWSRSCITLGLTLILVLCVKPTPAWAHGAPLDRAVTWSDWNTDIVVLLNLILLGWFYARGLKAIWRRLGHGHLIESWHAWSFLLGWLMIGLAVVSPLDLLSEQVAWAHMVQHMVLMVIAAPLVVLSKPGLVCFWSLSLAARRRLARLARRSTAIDRLTEISWNHGVVWSFYALVTWTWHIPVLYNSALRWAWVHDLQHACFFVAALLYWRTLVDPLSQRRIARPLAAVSLFATTLHTTVLGVLMTLSPEPWYWMYDGRSQLWGLTVLEDQQLAGLIMWMPACAVYLLAAIVLLAQKLNQTTDNLQFRYAFTGRGPQ